MWSKQVLATALVASTYSAIVTAVPSNLFDRGLDVCSSGIYGELAALKNYPIAINFCQAVYPPKCVDPKLWEKKRSAPPLSTTPAAPSTTPAAPSTTPKISTTPAAPSTTPKISTTPAAPSTTPKISTTSSKSSTTSSSSTTKSSTTTSKSSTTSKDPYASLWSKCQGQGGNVISTLCSCIQTHKPCPTTTAKTTTTTTAKTTTKSTTSSTTKSTTSSSTSSSTTSSSTSSSTTSSSTTSSSTTSSSTTSSSTSSSSTTSSSTTSSSSSSSSSTTSSSTTSSSSTTTTTAFTTPSTTTSSAQAAPTTCPTNAETYCDGNGCACGLQVQNYQPVCFGAFNCLPNSSPSNPGCNTNADCTSIGYGDYCVFDEENFCNSGRICATLAGCPQNIPQRKKRELEKVFEAARWAKMSRRAAVAGR